ncbi:hypothetical protein FACS1894104_4100 [Actinomycetota bacterium]|nr:hypothetical protein FACS1894104_4100 [Actinomycetota bacterium]
MSEATFGERLAEARRRKGETIEEVSEQLRIRPSIIQALETDNFLHMPHKGYTRNMVSSYARYLGLDSAQIIEQFVREYHRFENSGQARKVGNLYKPELPVDAATTQLDANGNVRRQITLRGQRETITAARRNRDRNSYWGKDDKTGIEREFKSHLRQAQTDKEDSAKIASRRAPSGSAKRVRTNDYVGKPPGRSVLTGVVGTLTSRPVLLIVGLVILFLAILIIWATLASSCSKNETTNVPLTSASQSDKGLTEDEVGANLPDIEAQLAEESKYGPFELMVEVADGSAWLQINVDGATPVAEIVDPPWSSTFTVNSICSIESGAPGYVKVYRNGIEVPLQMNNGLGVLELAVETRPIVAPTPNANGQ